MIATVLRALPSWIGSRVARLGPQAITALTGISREDWRKVARAFPELPADPGLLAVRARRRLQRLCARALASGRWTVRLEGQSLVPEPAIYVTAHIGALQALRYVLRARGVPAASVIGPFNLERTGPAKMDREFDRHHALDFPHTLASASAHRLRSALKRGSLILAADLPEARSVEAPLLGGRIRIDPRPFRLARAAGVSCRAAFLTLPENGWTLVVGDPLPAEESVAIPRFARIYAEVARRAPLDLDGLVYRNLTREGR